MKILVTGGLGVNGAWVTRKLIERGFRPVVLENRKDFSLLGAALEGSIDFVPGDVTDIDGVTAILKQHRIQRVIHMAALIDGLEQKPVEAFRVNAGGTVAMLEASVRAGVERFVYTSSRAVYGEVDGTSAHPQYVPVTEDHCQQPRRVYDVTKAASEGMGNNYASTFGIQFVALRFAHIYGPGKGLRHGSLGLFTHLIEAPLKGEPVVVPEGGDQRDDVIYVDDIAEAVVLAALHPAPRYRAYNIASGKGTTLHDFADAVRASVPGADIRIGPGLDYNKLGVSYFAVFDNTRAREDLGFTPRYDLKSGVAHYIETLRKLGLANA